MLLPLVVEGLANVRDLGGLERKDGSVTPPGVFIRAEALDRLSASGWEALRAHGVRTVIDLRRPSEYTGRVPNDIQLVRVDLDGDERDFWDPIELDGRWGTPLYYLAHLRELPYRLAEVLRAIAAADDGAVLFHCRPRITRRASRRPCSAGRFSSSTDIGTTAVVVHPAPSIHSDSVGSPGAFREAHTENLLGSACTVPWAAIRSSGV